MDTEKTIVRFYENSYQYSVVEVSMEGSYTDLFDAISNEFNKLHSYRGTLIGGLWAEVLYETETIKVSMFRVIEKTPNMVEIVELTNGVGFEPANVPIRWKWVVTSPKELDVLMEC